MALKIKETVIVASYEDISSSLILKVAINSKDENGFHEPAFWVDNVIVSGEIADTVRENIKISNSMKMELLIKSSSSYDHKNMKTVFQTRAEVLSVEPNGKADKTKMLGDAIMASTN